MDKNSSPPLPLKEIYISDLKDIYYTFCCFSGYFQLNQQQHGRSNYISIPNEEIRKIFSTIIVKQQI